MIMGITVGTAIAFVDHVDYEHLYFRLWSLGSKGEAKTNTWKNGKWAVRRMHQYIIPEVPTGMTIDHIDGNKLNNRRNNLRLVTFSQNRMNSNVNKNNTLGVRGVYLHGGKYQSEVMKDGKKYFLGTFKTIEEAKQAHDFAIVNLHGSVARLDSKGKV